MSMAKANRRKLMAKNMAKISSEAKAGVVSKNVAKS
jgi:hypothetical protein